MKNNSQNNYKYFMYCRKSSDSEDRQVQSIEAQVKELTQLAKENGINVIKVYEESKSAKSPGRPVFTEMINALSKGEADGLLVWKINRLARNPVDGGTISWLLQQGVIRHIQTYGRSYYPEDNVLMLSVELGMANQYVRDLSVDTKRGVRERAEKKGYPNGVAPIGFINDLSRERGDRGWKVDEERLPLIKRLLELYLTGKYSIRELTRIANEELLLRTFQRKRQGGKRLVHSYVTEQILKKPVYAGFFFDQEGKRYELCKDLPRIITEEHYWKIQKIMGSKGKPCPSTNKKVFPYTGATKCGGCGGAVTAENKYQLICSTCKFKFSYSNKESCPECGIEIAKMTSPRYLHYTYYHCTKRKNKTCKERSIYETEISKTLKCHFEDKLVMSKDLADWMIEFMELQLQKEEEVDKKINHKKEDQKSILKQQLDKVLDMKMNGLLDDEEYISKKNRIKEEISLLEGKIGTQNTFFEKTKGLIRRVKISTEIEDIIENGTFEDKKELLSITGSNLILKGKKISIHNDELTNLLINGLTSIKMNNSRFEPKNALAGQGRFQGTESNFNALLRG